MRKTILFLHAALAVLLLGACTKPSPFKYESVPGDPMQTRIYTLDNGLKIYLTANKETPRIQTYIAVRVGGKNDPAETTGLAHYFEHLMFKGTTHYGTTNYEAEKPLLDEIERLFEVYRKTSGEAERKAVYHQIDSISYEASKFAIPNEYDKLMAGIGATGTNAYTGYDETVYTEDIPSNQIENWARIQADRFQNPVIRGFHTELETVYEEKNMSLTNDNRKIIEAALSALYPDHPYGTQTVLGTQENLKNPSITNIKNYFKTWYVPNNIAICMSGDLDPDETVGILNKHFGGLRANPSLPARPKLKENPLKEPAVKEVRGVEAERVALAWRIPSSPENDDILNVVDAVLNNGKAGLLDADLTQRQKVLYCSSEYFGLADGAAYGLYGVPKQGQTLDEVKDLLLAEMEKLKRGDFDEGLLKAAVNNYKLRFMSQLDSNEGRADMFVSAFIKGEDWASVVSAAERMSAITKRQVTDFANRYFGGNYALVYKRQGEDPDEKKMEKPAITPIVMNRDSASAFLQEILRSDVKPIEPVFLDFKSDMRQAEAKSGIPVLYKENTTNDIFSLNYVFETGTNNDKAIGTAIDYLSYLGTAGKSLREISMEFYKLACSFSVSAGEERTYVTVSGLNENMPQAVRLLEELLAGAQADKEAYANLAGDILKARADAKLDQRANLRRLTEYALYGPDSPSKHVLSSAELARTDPQELVARIHKLNSYEHKILYYGPEKLESLIKTINRLHRVPGKLSPAPPSPGFEWQETRESKVYFAQYDAKQTFLGAVSNRGEKFDPAVRPLLNMYNTYFGGDMNSVVFQEMREARSLAYTASARLIEPSRLKHPYYYYAFAATQNDKVPDAIKTFSSIINNMPVSEKAFSLAKESLISRLRTQRVTKSDVLWAFLAAQDLGLSSDTRRELFGQAQAMTLADVRAFQEKWVKGREYVYVVLGDEKSLDMKGLEKYGPVRKLSQEELFGY